MPTLTAHTVGRTVRRLVERPTVFVASAPNVGALVANLEPPYPRRVYVCGARFGGAGIDGVRRWAAELPEGWAEHERGHYLEGEHPVVRVVAPDGEPVEVLRAAVYFGEGDYGPELAAAAWSELRDELARSFPRAVLLSSPAATGRELFLQSIPRGTSWDTMPDGLQNLIRHTSGQGRVELFPRWRAHKTIPALVEYDGRMMYAALCWGLPGGRAVHRRVDEYLGQTRARYFGRFRVPRDWGYACRCGAPGHRGIGVLPYAPPDPRESWQYPSEPGFQWQGWVDGAELGVALAHGWDFAPATAIVFDGYAGRGPLDTWARKLIGARERLAMRNGRGDRPALALAGDGVRAVILHAIGAFHGAAHRVTRSAPIDDADTIAVPAGARDLRVEHDRIVWAEYQGAAWPELSHPEWSAAIWARARARLLTSPTGRQGVRAGALHVPAGDVLAFRTDAVYLTRDPQWPDDGAAGRLRVQSARSGPLPTPRSHAELLAMRA